MSARTARRRSVTFAVSLAAATTTGSLVIPAQAHAQSVDWDAVATCESGSNWSINTGNGFGGGLQFTDSTWRAYGGSGQPEDASRTAQIAVAQRVLSGQGIGAWPVCGPKGLGGTTRNSGPASSSTPPRHRALSSVSSTSSEGHDTDTAHSSATPRTHRSLRGSQGPTYMVRPGDTLSGIGAAHSTTWGQLHALNAATVPSPNLIFPGQSLRLR